ncbi:shikimate dehydrogenase [Leeia aquatica]|nr:shikimate dehydrogenase [Leeia aquatica]
MMDRYAVIGNPIAHSKSPRIHAAFAAAEQQALHYEALLAPLDGFVVTVDTFRQQGGRGLNVTVPFKLEAFDYARQHGTLTARAELAGAVNTLRFDGAQVLGDNTDGVGLVHDLQHNLACPLSGKRVLLLGAGGAARGALLPLWQAQPAALWIANRTADKAVHLARLLNQPAVEGCGYPDLDGQHFDVVINASSSSLGAETLPLPAGLFAPDALAYDMMYADTPTAFLLQARSLGASRVADGLGMLLEQAAEAFLLWRGVRPDTAPVRSLLRPTPLWMN